MFGLLFPESFPDKQIPKNKGEKNGQNIVDSRRKIKVLVR